jgi:hypothetical protein
MQKFRETPSFGWTVLPIIYQAQNAVFDPFNQTSVPSSELLFEMDAIGGPEKNFSLTALQQLADAGVLFLDDQNQGSFLLPVQYDIIQGVVLNLSFFERTAIHFPQGRILAEQFERFHAEQLVREVGCRLSQSGELENYNINLTTGRNWNWFQSHAGQVFEVSPDNIRYCPLRNTILQAILEELQLTGFEASDTPTQTGSRASSQLSIHATHEGEGALGTKNPRSYWCALGISQYCQLFQTVSQESREHQRAPSQPKHV